MHVLARIIEILIMAIFVVIAVGIALVVLGANEDNVIVEVILDTARVFVRPFRDIFDLDDEKLKTAINWGIGAFVYLVVGRFVAGLLRR
jgi:hypothetical protein